MAEPFAHYMYVLECEDGSLYTGYSPDVEARLAAHKKGQGARYTQAHRPLRLVAQARFYTKGRALSAEAHFKKLSHTQKDRLLAMAAHRPLEDVLVAKLDGFPEDTASEFVARSLAQARKPSLKAFNQKLLPTLDAATIVGVPTSELRRIAKDLVSRSDARSFLSQLPHAYFEESLVQALAVGFLGSYEEALAAVERLLPYVDNWAVCDQIPLGPFSGHEQELAEPLARWCTSDQCYVMRFGLRVLMRYFLGERSCGRVLGYVAVTRLSGAPDVPETGSEAYYVDKARAWLLAEALAAQPETTIPYLEPSGLVDEWTRRAAIQKARESHKISDEVKNNLKTLPRRPLG